jgi:hypothetical protein
MGEQKREKRDLLLELSNIDNQAENRELLPEEWAYRYQVERKLKNLYLEEEIYWRQRIGKHWSQAGDSNTRFFHQFANGRMRKGTIVQLDTDLSIITEQQDIMDHVTQYYKGLFGPVEPR